MPLIVIADNDDSQAPPAGRSVVRISHDEIRAWVAEALETRLRTTPGPDLTGIYLEWCARLAHQRDELLLAAAVLHLARARDQGYLTSALEALMQTVADMADIPLHLIPETDQ